MILKGIAASEGIAIAKVFQLIETKIVIDKNPIKNVEAEIKKLEISVAQTINDIKKVKISALKNLTAEEAMVFDAHIQVVSDPIVLLEIKDFIKTTKSNVIFATKKIMDKYYEMFLKMDDPYMKERAADIGDVSKRLINNLAGIKSQNLATISEEVIIVSNDLTPSDTAQLNKKYVKGFATNIGGRTSHSAIMARSLEIPAVLGLQNITSQIKSGDTLILDGNSGEIIINPSQLKIIEYQNLQTKFQEEKIELQKMIGQKSLTKDHKEVELAGNIGLPKDVEGVIKNDGEAVGLFRSEFLYMDAKNWPTEEEQFTAYKTVLEKMNGKKVVIRTLDIGGDKTLSYFKFPQEMNPFLGYRAIRLTLDKKEVFNTQLRALVRASKYGKLAIMFPMIATIDEFKRAKAMYQVVYDELKAKDAAISDLIEVGMMVEIPAAAVNAKNFAKHVDFFSIGTNDLMQYTMAADRMNEKVSYLYQPLNPSILNLIKMTIDGAHQENIWVGMCGEMAGDVNAVPILLGLGLDEFSMSASSILKVRKLISQFNYKDLQKLASKALEKGSQEEVKELLKKFNS